MEDREISREEAIKRLEEGEPFNELYDPQWEAALALAIKALKAEPVKQERCEFCKDGITFWGAELILDNDGNWHRIRYCPNCGAKLDEKSEKIPRLIDANEILKSEHQHYNPMADEYYVPVRDIESALTVDAVPLEDYKSMERTVNKLTKALADAELMYSKRLVLRALQKQEDETEPVVRCKDCEFSAAPEWDSDDVYCTKHPNWISLDGCHQGRKKDEADRRR